MSNRADHRSPKGTRCQSVTDTRRRPHVPPLEGRKRLTPSRTVDSCQEVSSRRPYSSVMETRLVGRGRCPGSRNPFTNVGRGRGHRRSEFVTQLDLFPFSVSSRVPWSRKGTPPQPGVPHREDDGSPDTRFPFLTRNRVGPFVRRPSSATWARSPRVFGLFTYKLSLY